MSVFFAIGLGAFFVAQAARCRKHGDAMGSWAWLLGAFAVCLTFGWTQPPMPSDADSVACNQACGLAPAPFRGRWGTMRVEPGGYTTVCECSGGDGFSNRPVLRLYVRHRGG